MYNDNLARKQEYSEKKRGRVHDVEFAKHTNPVKKSRANRWKLFCVLIFFIAGSSVILFKNVQVTEQSNKIATLKSTYNTLADENKKKEIAINKKIDLKAVEEIAISNFNMNRARKEQVVYVTVKPQDYGVLTSDDELSDKTEKKDGLKGILAYLK